MLSVLKLLDPDPYIIYGSGSGSRRAKNIGRDLDPGEPIIYGSNWIRIRIRNTGIKSTFLFKFMCELITQVGRGRKDVDVSEHAEHFLKLEIRIRKRKL